MINRRGHARLLSERSLIDTTLEILAQKFQGHEPIEQRVARFVDRSHPANADRLDNQEMVEHALGAHFFAAIWTLHFCKRLSAACVQGSAACRTSLQCRRPRFSRHWIDCNIDNFPGT